MTAVVASTEIDRSPQEVFDYTVDPAHLADWQENVVSASAEGPLVVRPETRKGLPRNLALLKEWIEGTS